MPDDDAFGALSSRSRTTLHVIDEELPVRLALPTQRCLALNRLSFELACNVQNQENVLDEPQKRKHRVFFDLMHHQESSSVHRG